MDTASPRRECAPTAPHATGGPAHGTCRLTLAINGTCYAVRPIRAETFAALKAYRLTGPDRTASVVPLTLRGPECDCPGSRFQRDDNTRGGCMHLKALAACGLLDRSPFRPLPDCVPADGLSLADQADRQADAYRAWGTEVGDLFARVLDELALKIRFTAASTPDEYEGRIEVLDAELRDRWETCGYEEGRRAGCRCGECPVE